MEIFKSGNAPLTEKKVHCMCKPISDIRNKSAQDLLQMSGQIDKVPIDLKALLSKLKISCLARDFTSLEIARRKADDTSEVNPILGALVTNGDHAVIFYRQEDQKDGHRYRFTIAHELAHACLAHYPIEQKTVHITYRHEKTDSSKEIDANIFAGELLVPEKMLRKVISDLIFPSVQALADVFAVSKTVMFARLEYLKISENISGYNC